MSIVKEIRAAFDRGEPKAAYALYADIDDDDELATVDAAFPALCNYDRRGNYIGDVANENGWTA